jgi:hypothetical protein
MTNATNLLPLFAQSKCARFILALLTLHFSSPLLAQPVREIVSAAERATDTRPSRPTLRLPRRDYVPLHLVRHLDDGPAKENSGIVKSRTHADLYWLLNDSGDEPRIYPVHATGESYLPAPEDAAGDHSKLGALLDRAQNVDWEDIAVDDQGHVIVADLGNGHNDRQDLCLYFVEEPAPTASQAIVRKKVVVQYPDQTSFPADEDHFNFDCEAIFTVDNVVYVLTKHRSDNLTRLYRLDDMQAESATLTYVDEFDTHGGVVAADCSEDGLQLAVMTYQDIWLFRRADQHQSFFDGEILWGPYLSKQIEAVTFQDEKTLLLADEQLGDLYRVNITDLTPVQRDGRPVSDPDLQPYPTLEEMTTLKPGAWTMVVLPDTQYYVDHTRKIPPSPHVYESMTRWIVENKEARNIRLVVHVGDIVDNNDAREWEMARQAMKILDGQVPYIVTTGNHDYQDNAAVRQTLFNDYFQPDDNALISPASKGILAETFETGSLLNAIYEFEAPDGRDWLFVALEWAPRDAVVRWAYDVVHQRRYGHHTAVLVNHGYLYHDDTRFDWPKRGKAQEGNPLSYGMAAAGDNHDGEMLWRKLICESSPFQMVLCGHVTGTPEERMALGDRSEVGYRLSVGRGGNRVYQILFNAQRRGDAGDGWLRLFEFDPDQRTVVVKTYSPWLDQRGLVSWRTDGDDYFTFKLTHW